MKAEDAYRTSLPLVSQETATKDQAAIFNSILDRGGYIANLHKNMAHLPALLDTYINGFRLLKHSSTFTPREQEVIMLVLSRENGCEYCVAAHSSAADKISNVPIEVTNAIRDYLPVPDKQLQDLVDFVLVMFHKRGRITKEEAGIFFSAGYNDIHILWIIVAIAIKSMSNYTNHIFLTELDMPFKKRVWLKS